jgi:hypothetical protein
MDMFGYWAEQMKDVLVPIQLHIIIYITRMEQEYYLIDKLELFRVIYGQHPSVDAEIDWIKVLHSKQY